MHDWQDVISQTTHWTPSCRNPSQMKHLRYSNSLMEDSSFATIRSMFRMALLWLLQKSYSYPHACCATDLHSARHRGHLTFLYSGLNLQVFVSWQMTFDKVILSWHWLELRHRSFTDAMIDFCSWLIGSVASNEYSLQTSHMKKSIFAHFAHTSWRPQGQLLVSQCGDRRFSQRWQVMIE